VFVGMKGAQGIGQKTASEEGKKQGVVTGRELRGQKKLRITTRYQKRGPRRGGPVRQARVILAEYYLWGGQVAGTSAWKGKKATARVPMVSSKKGP